MFWPFASLSEDQFHTHLIFEILQGKVDKFEILLKAYEHDVSRIVARRVPAMRVTEMVQDVFVRAFFSLKTFRGIQPFRNWLGKIATRACYDFWRGEYREKEAPVSSLSADGQDWLERVAQDPSDSELEKTAARQEAREVLEWVMGRLSPDDRMVISLLYFEEKTVAEVAEIMDWTESNVKVHAFRARQKMREKLETLLAKEQS
jgi:RNA polymerase sigma-70 factor (ECF subfamily)